MAEVNRIAQYLERPTANTVTAVKRVMAYLATRAEQIMLDVPRVWGTQWETFTDSDLAGEGHRSRTGVITMVNGMVSAWRSNKQPVTSTSSAVAEIYALSEGCKDVQFINWRAEELGVTVKYPAVIRCDNQAAVTFQHGTCVSSRIRGLVDLREPWIKELRDGKKISAVHVPTGENVADMLTKYLNRTSREKLMEIVRSKAKAVAGSFRGHDR